MGPEIWDDYVVWYSYTGSPGSTEYSDIIMFDINAWRVVDITNDNPIQYEPDIDNGTVVWHDNRNGYWDIYSYDIGTNQENRLTFDGQEYFCPDIHNEKIVYYTHDRITNIDRKSTRLNSSHTDISRMPSSA